MIEFERQNNLFNNDIIDYIQAKAKVSFRDNNKIKSNTITMRISSDEKIWINASLGVWFTKRSF